MDTYKTQSEINFLHVSKIIYKDKDGTETELTELKLGDVVLWSSEGGTITVTYTIIDRGGVYGTFNFSATQGMTWRQLAMAYPNNFIASGSGPVTEDTENDGVIFGVYDEEGELVYFQDYWLARAGVEHVMLDDEVMGDEFMVPRTRSAEVISANGTLPMGECIVQATGAGTLYTFTATNAGAYTFTANSDNALIGYEKDGSSTFDGNAFTVKLADGEQIAVICTTLDWQDEEYCLTIIEN